MDPDLSSSSTVMEASSSAASAETSDSQLEEVPLPLVLRQFTYAVMKSDLLKCMARAGRLCFFQTQKWAAELLVPMERTKCRVDTMEDPEAVICSCDPAYFVIQNAMLRYQYGEAMYYAKMQEPRFSKQPFFRFLYFYNKYLHGQSQWIQNCDGPLEFAPVSEADVKYLQVLREELKQEQLVHGLDPLMKYLYGVILRQLGSYEQAREQLIAAIVEEPRMWCFWYELADCIVNREELPEVIRQVGVHWMRDFFLGRCYHLLNMTEEAVGTCKYLKTTIFAKTPYLMIEIAKVNLSQRNLQESIKIMEKVRLAEPTRLDDMDFYSNVLYIRGDKTRLSKLIRDLHEVDPYAPETNIAIATYYGLRDQHDKAVEHLTLALRTFPDLTHGWLCMGHEFFALKNNSRAAASYQKAVELNPREYRAWFGLGNVYASDGEKKYALAAVYYQKAAQQAFHEPRPWAKLGEIYERLDQVDDAAKAYWQAHLNGDKEEGAIVSLARLYEKNDKKDKALRAFERYIETCEEMGQKVRDDANGGKFLSHLGEAYLFVADGYYSAGRYAEAKAAGTKAAAIPSTMSLAKDFLQSLQEPGDPDFDLSLLEKTLDSDNMDLSAVTNTVQSSFGESVLVSDDEENLPSTSSQADG